MPASPSTSTTLGSPRRAAAAAASSTASSPARPTNTPLPPARSRRQLSAEKSTLASRRRACKPRRRPPGRPGSPHSHRGPPATPDTSQRTPSYATRRLGRSPMPESSRRKRVFAVRSAVRCRQGLAASSSVRNSTGTAANYDRAASNQPTATKPLQDPWSPAQELSNGGWRYLSLGASLMPMAEWLLPAGRILGASARASLMSRWHGRLQAHAVPLEPILRRSGIGSRKVAAAGP